LSPPSAHCSSLARKFTPVRLASSHHDKSSRSRKSINYAEDEQATDSKKNHKKKKKNDEDDEFEEDENGKMVKKIKRDRFGRPIKEMVVTPVKVRLHLHPRRL
jgi:hypothetical protein